MTDTRRNRFSFDRNYYESLRRKPIEGSAAKSVDSQAEYEEDYYDDQELFSEEYSENDFETDSAVRRRQVNVREAAPAQRVKVKTKKYYNFGLLEVLVICLLLVVLAKFCYVYIQARADIIQMNKKINTAKAELKDIQNKNAALESRLDVETDRNYIYTIAVSKLNMIYPKENDTIYYNKPYEGYVRQYYEIPSVK